MASNLVFVDVISCGMGESSLLAYGRV